MLYKNHLDINSAKCVIIVSSVKRVRLRCQKYLSPAQNTFATSDEHVHPQCDSYLEVSSRDYLVASDERDRLQCEIMFRGE